MEPDQLAKLHEVLAAINAATLAASLESKLGDREGERNRLLRDFAYFVKQAWGWVEDVPLQWNWHHDLLCNYLQHLQSGKLPDGRDFRDLNANVPPGTSKSVICSIFWPAWCRAKDPAEKVMAVSYSDQIVIRQSTREKSLIESDWYQAFFPEVQINPKVKQAGYWETTAGGWRFSGTRRKTATGLHPSIIAYDDLLSVKDADNETEREACNNWHDKTMASRGAGEAIGRRRINIQQRLHENDITGHLSKIDSWYSLCLPMEYEPGRMSDIGLGSDPRTKPGELLWPSMFPVSTVTEFKRSLGEDYYGQYQQRPVAAGGSLFKIDRINLIEPDQVPFSRIKRFKRAWDRAATRGGGCYTAGVLAGIVENGNNYQEIYIIDVVRGQWDIAEVEAQLKVWATIDEAKYGRAKYETVIEEEPGSSGKHSAFDTGRNTRGLRVRAVPTGGDPKRVRWDNLRKSVYRYEVFVVQTSWTQEFIRELATVPRSQFKDQVDSVALAYNELIKPGYFDLPDDDESDDVNLYESLGACKNKLCDRLARSDDPYCCNCCKVIATTGQDIRQIPDAHEQSCTHRHAVLSRSGDWVPSGSVK